MAKRDFNLKTSLVYSKDLLEKSDTEGASTHLLPTNESQKTSAVSPKLGVETTRAKPVEQKKIAQDPTPNKIFQQTFRMSKSDYDIIKGLIVYQRMNGKPTFTRGEAISLWVAWIQEKYPDLKPFSEEL